MPRISSWCSYLLVRSNDQLVAGTSHFFVRMDILRDQAGDATLRVNSTTPSHRSCSLSLCSSQLRTCNGDTIEIFERASSDQPVQPFTRWCEESLDQQVRVALCIRPRVHPAYDSETSRSFLRYTIGERARAINSNPRRPLCSRLQQSYV